MNTRQFSIRVQSGNRCLVNAENFPVYQNEITFLFGESGIGKSIITKGLYGLLDPEDLTVTINNKPYGYHLNDNWTKQIRRNGFFVFQEPSSHLNPLLTIREQLNEGSLCDHEDKEILRYLWQTNDDPAIRKIIDIFPKPYRPSGGEKQRILLAMAFKRINAFIENPSNEHTAFVFDEPTGSLDNNYRNRFLELLFAKYSAHPFTAIIITHDYSIISEIYSRHRYLVKNIHFKELSRTTEPDVDVQDFSPQQYLSWLQTGHSQYKENFAKETVLEFSSRFSIFNRNLCIYKDELQQQPSSLVINKGDMVYLKAPSGVGKTTLAKIVMGLYHADSFKMRLAGLTANEKSPENLWQKKIWGKKAGMVFQHADESLNMQATVLETFKGLPLKSKLNTEKLKKYLQDLFDPSTLTDQFLHKKVAFLSGGQKQRLNLLRTLIQAPNLIILDEPLNGLDFNSVKRVLELLNQKRSQGTSMLMISHNEEIFEHFVAKENIYYLSEI
jgi:ABC-type glutathione transport system ATPase component